MKIASVVENLSLNQSNFFMTKTFNRLGEHGIEPFCFYGDLTATGIKPNFATMNVYYLNNFYNGIIICNTINTLKILKTINTNARKMFYVWDLEWLRLNKSGVLNYKETVDILCNHNIELIARSENHASAIKNYCNRKVDYIISDWNIDEIRGLYDRRR
jgi:hypothetical protein